MSTKEILSQYKPVKDNLLLILHDLQDNNPEHFLTEQDIRETSKYLNITYAEVYGVVGYYTMFSMKPRGKNIIRICASPVCNMIGSESIAESLCKELSININETTKDSLFTLEESECLGHCHEAPVMMINEKVYGNLTNDKVREILNSYR